MFITIDHRTSLSIIDVSSPSPPSPALSSPRRTCAPPSPSTRPRPNPRPPPAPVSCRAVSVWSCLVIDDRTSMSPRWKIIDESSVIDHRSSITDLTIDQRPSIIDAASPYIIYDRSLSIMVIMLHPRARVVSCRVGLVVSRRVIDDRVSMVSPRWKIVDESSMIDHRSPIIDHRSSTIHHRGCISILCDRSYSIMMIMLHDQKQ